MRSKPRIRSIKPEFFRHEDLARMSAHARLAFIGLWGFADREGRLEYKADRLQSQLFPYEPEVKIGALIRELARGGFVMPYNVGTGSYLQVVNFPKHQKLTCREPASSIPAPPTADDGFPEDPSESKNRTFLNNQEGGLCSKMDGAHRGIENTRICTHMRAYAETPGGTPKVGEGEVGEGGDQSQRRKEYEKKREEKSVGERGIEEKIGVQREEEKEGGRTNETSTLFKNEQSTVPSTMPYIFEQHRCPNRRPCRIPDSFVLTPDRAAYARDLGISSPATTFDQFRDHFLANGKAMLDWEACWRNWCRNDRPGGRFGPRNGDRPIPPTMAEHIAEIQRDIEEAMAERTLFTAQEGRRGW